MKRGATTEHNYLAKVLEIGLAIAPGSPLRDIDVKHDEWCDVFHGGFCNCDPDVRLRPITSNKAIS